MNGPATPRCPACGAELVLAMDPAAPPDDQAVLLLADPPFRYGCASPSCPLRSPVATGRDGSATHSLHDPG